MSSSNSSSNSSSSSAPRRQSLRHRIRENLRRRTRAWIFGPETNFPGDPRRRIIVDETSTAEVKLVQFHDRDGHPVTVGKYTGITHSATIFHGGLHRPDCVGILHVRRDDNGDWNFPDELLNSKGPVVIGSDVLVGFEALIMSGVTIGHGAVVAPRAVVVRDVEPYEMVGGNPAQHIKYRFDEATREALLRIAWWDWPEEKIKRHRAEIDSTDVAGFVSRHDPALHNAGGQQMAGNG